MAYTRLRCLDSISVDFYGKFYYVINVNSTSSLMCGRVDFLFIYFFIIFTFSHERCSKTNNFRLVVKNLKHQRYKRGKKMIDINGCLIFEFLISCMYNNCLIIVYFRRGPEQFFYFPLIA